MTERICIASFALVPLTVLCVVSGANAASFGTGRGVGLDAGPFVGDTPVTKVAFRPDGFSHGHKVGFAGGHVPRGWSRGQKIGWHHASMPPGLHR
jgi:hypothetical protein